RDRQDVLEERIAEEAVARRDRVADRGVTLEEGRRLPDEVAVPAVRVRQAVDRQRRHDEHDRDGERQPPGDGPIARGVVRGVGCGVRRATLCYAPIHLPRSCRSRFPVTGPATGGTERDTRAPSRLTGTQGAVGAVLVVLALGLVLRLIIAYLLPGSGFEVDLGAFRYWASNLASEGLNGFYGRDFFHDYTPGYLYVLWLVGLVGNALGGVGALIKIPPILADLGIGYLAWSMVRELGGRDRLALAAAAVAVLNPISWFDSVVWG